MWQVNPIDLPSIFAAANNVKMQQEQLRQMQEQRAADVRQRADQGLLEQARANYFNGQPELLQRLAPKEFMDQEAGKAASSKNNAEAAKNSAEAFRAGHLNDANLLQSAMRQVGDNPERWPGVRAQLLAAQRSGALQGWQIPDQITPELAKQLSDSAGQAVQVFGEQKYTEDMRNAAAMLGTTDVLGAMRDPKWQEALQKAQSSKATKVSVNNGMTTATQTDLEKKMIETTTLDQKLKRIDSLARPEMFTAVGRMGGAWRNLKDVAGMTTEADKQQIRDRREMNELISQTFDQYRREVTGAGASVKELETLKDSILNSDLGPTEFEASLKRFMGQVRSDEQRYGKMLGPKNAIGGSAPKADARTRYEQLKAKGMTTQQIADTMRQEGFAQ